MKNVPKSVLEALSIGLALNVMLFDVGLDWILCTEQQWNVSLGHCQCPFSPVQFNRAAALGALSCIAPCLCPNYKMHLSLIAFKTCSSLGVHFRRLALSCFAAIGCTATSCLTPTMCPFKWARRFYSRENTLSLWAWHWHTPRCISANKCCPAKLCLLQFGWNVSNSICSAKYCWMKYAVGVRNVDITIGETIVKPTRKSGLLVKNECYWQNMALFGRIDCFWWN